MSFVQGQHIACRVSVGEDYDGCVGQAKLKFAIAVDDHLGRGNIGWTKRLETIGPAYHFFENGDLCG